VAVVPVAGVAVAVAVAVMAVAVVPVRVVAVAVVPVRVVAVAVVPARVMAFAVMPVPVPISVSIRQGAGLVRREVRLLLVDREVLRRPTVREPGHPMVVRPPRVSSGEPRGPTSLTGHVFGLPP